MGSSRQRIPDLHAQPPAADFIDNHADQYHPAFSEPPSQYDPSFGLFMIKSQPPDWCPPPSWEMMAAPQAGPLPLTARGLSSHPEEQPPPRPLAEPVEALKFWDTLFPLAMGQFKEEHPIEPEALVQSGIGIRNEQDWTSVFDKLETARQVYSNVDKGFKAKFKNIYRTLADRAVQPLLNITGLVPDVEYITPVLGIIEILLEAAKTASRVRQEILGAFDDIDMTFSQVELFLQLYGGDQNVQNASVSLISATFYAIESAIKFFVRSTWKKGFSATLKGEDYQKEIMESLANVKSLTTMMIDEAENSHKWAMSNAMKEILRRTREWQETCQQLLQMPHLLRNGFMVLLNELQMNRRDNFNLTLAVNDMRDALSRASSPTPQHDLAAAGRQHIVSQTLLDWIDIPDLARSDMEYIAERRNRIVPADEQVRAEQIVRTQQFGKWLASPSSTQLLVHGNYDRQRYVSGLSLFCQTLAQSLTERTAHPFLHLIFYCGLHFKDEYYTGGRALIQSFICQLLCQFDFDAAFARSPLSSEITQELIELGDIETLCELFEILVRRLPREIVLLCLIDGVVYFEREEFEDDLGAALVTILSLSGEEQNTHAAMKVLITSPTKTVDVRQPFPEDLILSMESLPGMGMVASQERLIRVLSEEGEAFPI